MGRGRHTPRMLRALLGCLVVLPLAASAQDCALDAKAIAPQFASKLPKGAKLLSTKKQKLKITQSLKLADGTEVSVDFGGCERVQYTFTIKSKGLTTKTVGAEVVAISKRVLSALPMSKDALAEPRVLLAALEEGSFQSLPATLSCGSGSCRVELVPVADKKKPAPKKPSKKDAKDGKDSPDKADDAEQPATLQLSYDAAI